MLVKYNEVKQARNQLTYDVEEKTHPAPTVLGLLLHSISFGFSLLESSKCLVPRMQNEWRNAPTPFFLLHGPSFVSLIFRTSMESGS
jgi:hypothetical protein